MTGPINLGNPDECTIAALADAIVELTGSSSSVEYKPLPDDDPVRRRPDVTLARETLDWAPSVPLRDGLAQTITYFERLLSTGSN